MELRKFDTRARGFEIYEQAPAALLQYQRRSVADVVTTMESNDGLNLSA
jgi:hypothetical protein